MSIYIEFIYYKSTFIKIKTIDSFERTSDLFKFLYTNLTFIRLPQNWEKEKKRVWDMA